MQVQDYSLVRFLPFSVNEESLIEEIAFLVDNALQYGEHEDVKVRDFEETEAAEPAKDGGD